MSVRTGETINENFLSLDENNTPVTGTTFDTVLIENGLPVTGCSISISLIDSLRGIYSASWSSNTIGEFQVYIKNNSTGVIFITNVVEVRPDSEFERNIYIGL